MVVLCQPRIVMCSRDPIQRQTINRGPWIHSTYFICGVEMIGEFVYFSLFICDRICDIEIKKNCMLLITVLRVVQSIASQ